MLRVGDFVGNTQWRVIASGVDRYFAAQDLVTGGNYVVLFDGRRVSHTYEKWLLEGALSVPPGSEPRVFAGHDYNHWSPWFQPIVRDAVQELTRLGVSLAPPAARVKKRPPSIAGKADLEWERS